MSQLLWIIHRTHCEHVFIGTNLYWKTVWKLWTYNISWWTDPPILKCRSKVNHKLSRFLLGTASCCISFYFFPFYWREKETWFISFLLAAPCLQLFKGNRKESKNSDPTPKLVKSLKDCCQSPEKRLWQLCSEEFSTTSVTCLTSQRGLLSLSELVKQTGAMTSLRITLIWNTITSFTSVWN